MASPADFSLHDREDGRPWQLPPGGRGAFVAGELYLGQGEYPLEVVTASAEKRPNLSDVRSLWKRRHAGRPSPVLLVVAYPGRGEFRVAVCGPVGEDPPVLSDLDPGQADRVAFTALEEPDKHAAIRFLHSVLPEVESELPGVRNAGMFANHELRSGLPARGDWTKVREGAKALLSLRGPQLIQALGYTIEQHSTTTSFLKVGDKKRVVAVFLEDKETPEGPSARFSGLSPVSQALAVADSEGLPYVVLTRGSQIRIYAAGSDVGVGRKGRANTFIELHLALLSDEQAGYLPLIFGADALLPSGTFHQILEESRRFATDLGTRLRDRVYIDMVPSLATAVANHYEVSDDDSDAELDFIYDEVLTVLFRLLFIAYAEDKDLLPFRSNGVYQRHALKTLAQELADHEGDQFDADADDLWSELLMLFRAIEVGNKDWGVPAYDGGLFTGEREVSEVGYELAQLVLTNSEIGPALRALLVDKDQSGILGPVDFRSLSVREFGTIYEGLLESSLSLAQSDLTIDKDGQWVPAKKGDVVEASGGEIYLHNRSGARKASGSYFTKPFAVEHLLDHSLEPALNDHVARLERLVEAGDENEAAEAFFDFRCADIAMGSGHFLVAAVDRIEARLSGFLARRPLPRVIAELDRLHDSAIEALGDLAEGVEIEHASLLRRQVARRCVYGVDLNSISVELARLSLWIHTFVPGLPLSFLDHGLVQGNSLTGVGTIEEALSILDPASATGTVSLFKDQVEAFLQRAEDSLARLARTSEATMKEIGEARKAQADAELAVEPAGQLFNLLLAARLGRIEPFTDISEEKIAVRRGEDAIQELTEVLQPVHFPVVFPEVFMSPRGGFDCIVGNPPWEEATLEERAFWARHGAPARSVTGKGLRDLIVEWRRARPDLVVEFERETSELEALRAVLHAGPYPGMETGDPDLYKAFAWRFLQLSASSGHVGVVLPRSIFATQGSAPWREAALLTSSSSIALCKNKGGWLFDDVNPGYSICLVCSGPASADEEAQVVLSGPFTGVDDFVAAREVQGIAVPAQTLRQIDPLLTIPDVDSSRALAMFLRLSLRHPRFGQPDRSDFRARPVTELHATNDSTLFRESGDPVYNHRNIGHLAFDINAGSFAFADFDEVSEFLFGRREKAARNAASPFADMSPDWLLDRRTLPCLNPRVAFRDVVHASNPRKVWCALVPARTLLTNKAPYLLFSKGDVRAQAYVLGMLASSLCDWFGHRRITLNLNFFILNGFPMPLIASRDERVDRLIRLSATLAVSADGGHAGWRDLVLPDGLDRLTMLAELDALASLLFGVDDDETDLLWSPDEASLRPALSSVTEFREKWKGSQP
jgi:hypothetical protein